LNKQTKKRKFSELEHVDTVTRALLTFFADIEFKSSDVADVDMILDVGPDTQALYRGMLASAKTILWNGPVGVFEFPQFEGGTRALSEAIASSDGFSLAGGGDTLAAIDQFGIADQISYISTGGGAFLEFVEGKELPAVQMLKTRSNP